MFGRFYTGRKNFINKKGLFYAKFFEFEEFSIVPFFCNSIQPQHTMLSSDGNRGAHRLTAFLLFAKKTRPKVLEANPGLDFSSLNQKLRELWSSLPNSDKAIWKRKLNRIGMESHSNQQHRMTNNSGQYKVTGIEPIDAAAHLKLLGESLSVIGQRLTEHKGQIAVSGSLSVLLDSLLCAMGPLVCLTKQVPELHGAVPQEKLNRILDNIAYVMPGL